MVYEMSVVEVPQVRVLAIRGHCPPDDLPAFVGSAFGDLYRHLGLLGAAPAGPPFVLYHAFEADGVDAEACVPIRVPIQASGRIESRVVPGATVVRTCHIGPYDTIRHAYAADARWADDHGYEVIGAARERYLHGPGGPDDGIRPEDYLTEIDLPIAPVLVAVEEAPPAPVR